MAPLPNSDEKASSEDKPKPVPSGWKIAAKTFNTVSSTVGFLGGLSAFLLLMRGFAAHLQMVASKYKAQKKLEAMERIAEEEDSRNSTRTDHRKREVTFVMDDESRVHFD